MRETEEMQETQAEEADTTPMPINDSQLCFDSLEGTP